MERNIKSILIKIITTIVLIISLVGVMSFVHAEDCDTHKMPMDNDSSTGEGRRFMERLRKTNS